MSFFRIPLEAQNKMLGIFGALGQFVGQAIFGGLQRFGGFLVIFLELFPARFVDFVTGVFDNHDVLSLLCRNAVRSRELASSAKIGHQTAFSHTLSNMSSRGIVYVFLLMRKRMDA